MEAGTVDVLEPWLDELWVQRLDGSGMLPCRVLRTSKEGKESAPVNWSNKSTHLPPRSQFHQSFNDAGLRVGLDSAIGLAKAVSGPRLTTKEKA